KNRRTYPARVHSTRRGCVELSPVAAPAEASLRKGGRIPCPGARQAQGGRSPWRKSLPLRRFRRFAVVLIIPWLQVRVLLGPEGHRGTSRGSGRVYEKAGAGSPGLLRLRPCHEGP